MRVQHLEVQCSTKTKDNVFVEVSVAVQYQANPELLFEAAYKLQDPRDQIRTYVNDVVRSTLPRMLLDDAFASKDEVANAVERELSKIMKSFGYNIVAALVTDLVRVFLWGGGRFLYFVFFCCNFFLIKSFSV